MAAQTITNSDSEYVTRTITDKQLAYSDGPTRSFKISGANLGATSNTYADKGLIGKLLKLENAVRDTKGYTTLMSIVMQDKTNQKSKLEAVFFDAEPTNTTFTDDVTLDIDDDDLDKVIGQVIVEEDNYQSYNDNAVGTKPNIGLPLKSNAGKDLWMCFISRGTPTYVANELSAIVSFYG